MACPTCDKETNEFCSSAYHLAPGDKEKNARLYLTNLASRLRFVADRLTGIDLENLVSCVDPLDYAVTLFENKLDK